MYLSKVQVLSNLYLSVLKYKYSCTWPHVWYTPPESPDLNPVELVWGSLKQYLRNSAKPKNLAELKQGIKQFWRTLMPEVCWKYISHLKKVIPKIIQVEGDPSGY